MNKKLLLVALLAVAGFVTLTAFGGKTREQQQAEIQSAVQARLEEFRLQKQTECDDRVKMAAQTRYDEYLATMAAADAGKTGTKKTGKGSKGPKVDPIPTKPPTDPQKTRSGASKPGDVEEQKKRSGASPTNTPPDPSQQKRRPGASGGGN